MFTVLLLLTSAIVGTWAACNYEIKNIKIEPCNGKPVPYWELNGVGAEFTDDCDILIKGCFKLKSELNNLMIEYRAIKNGLEVTRGTKDICGMKLFDTKFDCPLAKGKTICATKSWIQALPKGMISMAVGNIKGEAKVKSSAGESCYKVSGDIKRK